ncbi:divergent polysaccharide deacetylase family protein [Aquibium carbonis]|uniref:Divergent polysaccharide deacetylase family protein n=1 Tax=Aquibium carbonis TaxID=2495581 RepID=A0A3S0A5I7_9HYPH|nr:divergent polysaccharide deacetylase family protein [Aquibium carbonis]RST85226.1 divergent polysaccharide deacetylase family protein [Aquibium carbonis]
MTTGPDRLPVIKELERPLGQDRRDRPARRLPRLRAVPFVSTIIVLAVVGAGAGIALRPDPFRVPDVELAVDETAGAVEGVSVATRETAPVPLRTTPADGTGASGPSVIRVSPPDEPSSNVIVIRDPSALGRSPRVAHLPDRALLEQSEMGPLPVRAADGRRAAEVYARPWSGTRGARIAVVIGGLGLSQTGTQAAIAKLPSEITLAFAPQGNSLGRWMQTARSEGHEIMMQLPLEPFDYPRINPGRNTLTVEAEPRQNIENLYWALTRTTNYTGVMNYMGGRFTSDHEAFAPIMRELGERGLSYLDDGSSARSLAERLAGEADVPYAQGDLVIDQARDRGSILSKLDQLEATARARGYAVGTGTAFDVTVDTVSEWARAVRMRGIEIVPVSAVMASPGRG